MSLDNMQLNNVTNNINWGGYNDDEDNVCKRKKLENSSILNSNLWNERIYSVGTQIHFTADINKDTIERLIKVFTKVIAENSPKFGVKLKKDECIDIEYIVDSPGGCVSSVLKFVDFLNMVKSKHSYIRFTSIITGMVASAGTIMTVVADRRYMTKNSFTMIHELSSGSGGKYTQLISYADYITKLHKKIIDIYLLYTPIKRNKLESLLQKESWFDSKEYKKLGFVDDIKPFVERKKV